MKLSYYLVTIACLCSFNLVAQNKDTMKLSCPLNGAIIPPVEKPAYSLGAEQPKVFLTSQSDTTVRACSAGTVTTVMRDEEGKWEIMFNNKDYYYWYSGLTKANVTKGQKLKSGEAVGTLKTGNKLELMLYDFETPVDPKKYLQCGN